jgi:hypothetical protein
VNGASALDGIRSSEVEAYLLSRDWRKIDSVDIGTVWISPDDRAIDVFVPRRSDFGDYVRRLTDLIGDLSDYEARPESEILSDFVLTTADVIRFRLTSTFEDNTITLDEGVDLFERARETLRAAAWATIERQPFYVSKPPPMVSAYLESVRLGQTEAGSYVVPIITPLGTTEPMPDEVVGREDEPFGRFVSVTFANSLAALELSLQAVRSSGELTPFADAVSSGVSANLCDAIGQLASSVRAGGGSRAAVEHAVSIDFSWSVARPVRADVRSDYSISDGDSSLLRDAAEFLRALVPHRRVTVVGKVVRLERGAGQSDGTIAIRGAIESGERVVEVKLRASDYARAIHAHEAGVEVTCSGVLERRGNYSYLSGPVEFTTPPTLF